MSANELVIHGSITPTSVASDLLSVIKDIELHIENASGHVSRIEGRNFFKSVFSSDKTDLVNISKSQNKINEMMLDLIQEVITLNTMSYAFLAAVISELEQRARDGWHDSEGKFQSLSDTGRNFADKAKQIFCKIAEGSRHTQDRIALNAANIIEIREALQAKEDTDTKQSQEIDRIQQALSAKVARLDSIDELLGKKSLLDNRQDKAIHAIVEELRKNSRQDQQRSEAIAQLEQDLKQLHAQVNELESRSATDHGRLKLWVSVLASSTAVLAVAMVLSFAWLK